MDVTAAKLSATGKSEKMEMLYEYLSGPEFRQQVEGIVEAFSGMRQDLDQEKRAMERIWAKREKQIERVVKNMGRMYGSMQGVIGQSLPELDLPRIKGPHRRYCRPGRGGVGRPFSFRTRRLVRTSPFGKSLGKAGGRALPPRDSRAERKASLLIPALTPPIPHASLRGLRYSCRIRRELF